MSVTSNVEIMTSAELRAYGEKWFQKGVERGRFEQRMDVTAGETAPPPPVPVADGVREALEFLLEVTEPPERNCSCHLNPPCGDCVDYGAIRDAHAQARAALTPAATPSEPQP